MSPQQNPVLDRLPVEILQNIIATALPKCIDLVATNNSNDWRLVWSERWVCSLLRVSRRFGRIAVPVLADCISYTFRIKETKRGLDLNRQAKKVPKGQQYSLDDVECIDMQLKPFPTLVRSGTTEVVISQDKTNVMYCFDRFEDFLAQLPGLRKCTYLVNDMHDTIVCCEDWMRVARSFQEPTVFAERGLIVNRLGRAFHDANVPYAQGNVTRDLIEEPVIDRGHLAFIWEPRRIIHSVLYEYNPNNEEACRLMYYLAKYAFGLEQRGDVELEVAFCSGWNSRSPKGQIANKVIYRPAGMSNTVELGEQ